MENDMRQVIARILAPLANGVCPRCQGPLTAAGNCANLCGGA